MVDTLDSKSGVSNDVPVQVRFAVPAANELVSTITETALEN